MQFFAVFRCFLAVFHLFFPARAIKHGPLSTLPEKPRERNSGEVCRRHSRESSLWLFLTLLYCVCNPHIQESPHPRAPESPKSLKKDFPGLPVGSVKKVSKKSPNTDFEVFFSGHLALFRHFFDTPGREAREHHFETFWGFRAQRALGLLYMAAPIATFVGTV